MALRSSSSSNVGPGNMHGAQLGGTRATFKEVIRQLFITKGNIGQATHRLLDGGNLCVPTEKRAWFLERYMAALAQGERVYVVTLKTEPVFRMFFDLDIHLSRSPDENPVEMQCQMCEDESPGLVDSEQYTWLLRLCKYIMTTLIELFDESLTQEEGDMLVCIAPSKTVKKGGVNCTKHGLHIHFPNLHVDTPMALRIRHAVVQKLSNNLQRSSPTTWSQDIDEAVYGPNGLRMLYSRKTTRCKCASKNRDECQECFGEGRIDEGRAYMPLWKISMDCTVTSLSCDSPLLSLVEETCIRSQRNTPSHRFNVLPPCWFEDPTTTPVTTVTTSSRSNKRKSLNLVEGHHAVEGALANKEPLCDTDRDTLRAWMDTQIRKRTLPKEYKGVAFMNMFSFTMNGTRSHVIARMDSQYCMNIGREHSTNTVYLEINLCTKKAFMRCYCRCDTTEGRRKLNHKNEITRCRDYRSEPLNATDLRLSIWNGSNRQHSATAHPSVLAII
jgi:hypothetical protein